MRYEVPGVLDLTLPESEGVPLILDSPHSGRDYPEDFQPLVGRHDLRRVEDAYVDSLFERAPDFGATLLNARFPRTYIDANRAATDLDPAMLLSPWPETIRPSEKSRLGHGLVWKTYPPDRPLYPGKLPVDAVRRRINEYWLPYHETLETEIRRLHITHGQVWHLNCHSMPSTSSPYIPGRAGMRADFVLGDRDGTTCGRDFTVFVRDTLEAMGYSVRLNDPYRGAELVRAYAAPTEGRHSLQIEINRALYLDEQTIKPGRGFDTLRHTLTELIRAVADYTRDRIDPVAEAAE
ncbi:MAG: N-formylglutamate amidohydrolase [Alphaproteobacteria bacterium]|nr:N-formylglutamate amidohydrolase [Alphaproteobacteria bacterium]